MVKAHFLFIITITSAFLLTIQLIALQYLIHQATVEEPTSWKLLDTVVSAADECEIALFLIDPQLLHHIRNGTHLTDKPSLHSSSPEHQKRGNKRKAAKISHPSRSFYEQSAIVSRTCRVFCNPANPITHLATLADFGAQEGLTHLSTVLSHKHGLTVLSLTDTDPTLEHLNLHVTIQTHIIIIDEDVDIRKDSHVVHISILHERLRGQYWWQAPIKMTQAQERLLHRQGLKRTAFRLPHSSAIFAKTEILRTTIDGLNILLPLPSDPFLAENKHFIACNQRQANEFYGQYPKEDSYEATQFRSKATALLAKVRHLLEEDLHIPFWLSSGTLLGYYRQCDFITYSGDVDIGIWADDYRPELIEVFSVNNIPLIHWFGRPNDSLELSFVSGDLKLDIFFFYREYDHYWNGGTQARTGLKFKYDFPKFSLCWTDFIGMLVRIPCETQTYIEANYGREWATPVKSWDWKSSPPNVRPNGQWEPHEWRETIRLIPLPNL